MNKIKRKVMELDEFTEEIRGKVDDLADETDMTIGYVIILTSHMEPDGWARETIANMDHPHIIELLKSALKVASLAESAINTPTTEIH